MADGIGNCDVSSDIWSVCMIILDLLPPRIFSGSDVDMEAAPSRWLHNMCVARWFQFRKSGPSPDSCMIRRETMALKGGLTMCVRGWLGWLGRMIAENPNGGHFNVATFKALEYGLTLFEPKQRLQAFPYLGIE